MIGISIVSNMNDHSATAAHPPHYLRRSIKRIPLKDDGAVDYDEKLKKEIGYINYHFMHKKEVLERRIQQLEQEREKQIKFATDRNTIAQLEGNVDLVRAAENYLRVEAIEDECWASKAILKPPEDLNSVE